MPRRDYIIIIGAMKSGTTTLFDILARHPEIAPARDKEPGFFAFEELWEQGFDWFDTLFEFDPTRHRYRLEASTDYSKEPFATAVWTRMTANPDVSIKLVYIMRHPFRRLESHARHVQGAGSEVKQHPSPRPSHSLDAGLSLVNMAASQYATQLDAYADAKMAGDLYCLTLEALREDPETVLADLFRFLDLNPDAVEPELPVSNAAAGRTEVHPLWRWMMNIRPLMAIGKRLMPAGVRSWVHRKFRQRANVEGRFELTEAETAMLTQLYAGEMSRLRQDYGIDTQRFWEL